MGKVFEVGDEYIREDDVKDEINDILIDFLENKVQEEVNSKIFQ